MRNFIKELTLAVLVTFGGCIAGAATQGIVRPASANVSTSCK
jgi:hypothetical protein